MVLARVELRGIAGQGDIVQRVLTSIWQQFPPDGTDELLQTCVQQNDSATKSVHAEKRLLYVFLGGHAYVYGVTHQLVTTVYGHKKPQRRILDRTKRELV
ncbi:MAG: hypothetical protein NTU53_19190 [Planctomycetota bacterium]|nr:hypothetical protein [Planctomycetota bacterium]